MGRDVFSDAGYAGVFLDDAFDGTRGEAAVIARGIDGLEIAAVIEEERGEGIGAAVEITLNPVGGGFRDEDGTIFAAFAADDKLTTVEIDRIAIELDELGDAETAREEKFDDSAVAKAGLGLGVDGVEEGFDFVVVEEGNLLADDVGKFDESGIERFNLAFGEVFEEAAQGDEMVSLGDGLEAFAGFGSLAVELETEFTDELSSNVFGLEIFCEITGANFK